MSFREMFFGKKVQLPGVENTATMKPIIPSSEEGQKAMAAEKNIHPYSEQAALQEQLDVANKADPFVEEDESEEDIDVSDLK